MDRNRALEFLGELPADLAELDAQAETEAEASLPTLAERGLRLPIGFRAEDGSAWRDFELTPWTWAVEEELGKLAEDRPDMPIDEYVGEVIGRGISKLGPLDVATLSHGERRLLVRNMYFSDALYAYLWIRIEALGANLRLDAFPCPSCGALVSGYTGDLRTLEVKAFDEIPERSVTTEHGVEFAGERLSTFRVGPLRWGFMEGDPGIFANPAKFKAGTLRNSIVGIEGAPEGPTYLTDKHIRSMSPRDVNRLVREIDQCNGGAVLELSGICPACEATFKRDVDWSYESFFAPSSH